MLFEGIVCHPAIDVEEGRRADSQAMVVNEFIPGQRQIDRALFRDTATPEHTLTGFKFHNVTPIIQKPTLINDNPCLNFGRGHLVEQMIGTEVADTNSRLAHVSLEGSAVDLGTLLQLKPRLIVKACPIKSKVDTIVLIITDDGFIDGPVSTGIGYIDAVAHVFCYSGTVDEDVARAAVNTQSRMVLVVADSGVINIQVTTQVLYVETLSGIVTNQGPVDH